MMWMLLLKGMGIGFSIAAPVGPIGVLCMRRTLQKGRVSGMITGLGAAFADAIFGATAAFGLTALTDLLFDAQYWLRLFGGLFLIYLGIRIFRSSPIEQGVDVGKKNLPLDFFSTFFLTLTNPLTILSFMAVFAGLGFSDLEKNSGSASFLISGVFLGSMLWWLILSGSVSVIRRWVNQKGLKWVHRFSSGVLLFFGMLVLISLFFKLSDDLSFLIVLKF